MKHRLFLRLVFSQVLNHDFETLFISLKFCFKVLDVSVFVVDCTLEATHSQEELGDLKTQLFNLISLFLIVSLSSSPPLQLLLIVSKLEALLLKLPHPLLQILILSYYYVRRIASSPLLLHPACICGPHTALMSAGSALQFDLLPRALQW